MFGCVVFPYIRPYQSHKFSFRTENYVLVGYSLAHKRYKCMSSLGKLYITKNVKFNEIVFLFLYDPDFIQTGFPFRMVSHKYEDRYTTTYRFLFPQIGKSCDLSSLENYSSETNTPGLNIFSVDLLACAFDNVQYSSKNYITSLVILTFLQGQPESTNSISHSTKSNSTQFQSSIPDSTQSNPLVFAPTSQSQQSKPLITNAHLMLTRTKIGKPLKSKQCIVSTVTRCFAPVSLTFFIVKTKRQIVTKALLDLN